MTIVNALFLIVSQAACAPTDYADFVTLTKDLDQIVEWIDEEGIQTLTKSQAKKKLLTLASGITDDEIKVRHSSQWKNGQCFRIVLLSRGRTTHRLYFQCIKDIDDSQLVTKIKVSRM